MTLGGTENDSERYNLRHRRHNIERLLIEYGLLRINGRSQTAQESPVRRLRWVLEKAGPVFALFGRYLSSRADWIPVRDCLELDAIDDRAPVLSPEQIKRLFHDQLGEGPERIFLTFDAQPHACRATFQIHHARLVDGTPIHVDVLHPTHPERIQGELGLLPLLQEGVAAAGWTGFTLDEAVTDFARTMERRREEPVSLKPVNLLAEDERLFHQIAVPRVYEAYSSRSIRTMERLSGWSLEELIRENATPPSPSFRRNPFDLLDLRPSDIARLVHLVWLRQAVYGRTYPIDLHPGDIWVLNTHQIAFTGGIFAALPTLTKENVRQYLNAAAAADPDRAYRYLTPEMEEVDRARNEQSVRNRFRQIVPFRDGPWDQEGAGDLLAEHLMVHWRIVREHGYHVRIHMRDFYRGLFTVVRQVNRLAPHQDALKEGLEDLRYAAGISEMRDMMDENVWRDTMGRYTVNLLQLPHLLNEALTGAAVEDPRPPRTVQKERSSSSAVLAGALCLMTVVAIMLRHFETSGANKPWIHMLGAGLFMAAGLAALRAVYRK